MHEAMRANQLGMDAERAGRLEEARAQYARAMALLPEWDAPPFNYGLLEKRARNWAESKKYSELAARLDPDNQGAFWNAGIASVALADWEAARRAWAGAGLKLPEGTGEYIWQLGMVPIRLNPEGDAEVVWCDRIGPARGIIRNIPFPTSGHRFGDVVLHDGAPEGHRVRNGKQVPVFNALEVLSPSRHATWEVRVQAPSDDDLEALAEALHEVGGAAEDWTRNVRMLCTKCSEGVPHEHHTHEGAEAGDSQLRVVGVAATGQDQVEAILNGWANTSGDRQIVSTELKLDCPS